MNERNHRDLRKQHILIFRRVAEKQVSVEDLLSEEDMLKRRQSIIEQQGHILELEEELHNRQKGLIEYEKEVRQCSNSRMIIEYVIQLNSRFNIKT